MKSDKFNFAKILVENRWVWHCCFWLFYILYVLRSYYITVMYYEAYLNFMLVSDLFFVCFVYATLFLYNRMIPRKQYLQFLFIGALFWLGMVVLRSFLMIEMMKFLPNVANSKLDDIILSNLPTYIQFYVFVVIFKYLKDSFILQYHQNQRQKLQMRFELENLKAQISPHFLFNTMNNFYGLAVENSKKLPDLMIRLSDLLRYSLYETQQEKVQLKDELEYLKNYIELEKIRLEENLDLNLKINVTHPEKYQIAPLLFIIFIENAFKHAKATVKDPVYISIDISVSEKDQLKFVVRNNYNTDAKESFGNERGIGLENAKKRLNVIYPDGKHELRFQRDELFYTVILTIELN